MCTTLGCVRLSLMLFFTSPSALPFTGFWHVHPVWNHISNGDLRPWWFGVCLKHSHKTSVYLVEALRASFCLFLVCGFRPPVGLAFLPAIKTRAIPSYPVPDRLCFSPGLWSSGLHLFTMSLLFHFWFLIDFDF